MVKWLIETACEEFKENPGRPFIIAFMILLIIAAIFLALGNEFLANKFAEYAYYNLVLGVVLQLIAIIKEERRKSKVKK